MESDPDDEVKRDSSSSHGTASSLVVNFALACVAAAILRLCACAPRVCVCVCACCVKDASGLHVADAAAAAIVSVTPLRMGVGAKCQSFKSAGGFIYLFVVFIPSPVEPTATAACFPSLSPFP